VLLAVNHTAFIDGPLVYGLIRRPTAFLIKAEMFHGPVGAVLYRIGQIPIHRGVPEGAPLRIALDVLAAGGVIGVFPEGTRGHGEVHRVERGIAYLALRSGCPVVPVACHGTAALRPAGRRGLCWRPRVRVVFGEPVAIAGGQRATRQAVTTATEQVRQVLAAHVAASRPAAVRLHGG
jgi:1-acyl-sn-glycerol-3-phosphate acyltransferase